MFDEIPGFVDKLEREKQLSVMGDALLRAYMISSRESVTGLTDDDKDVLRAGMAAYERVTGYTRN